MFYSIIRRDIVEITWVRNKADSFLLFNGRLNRQLLKLYKAKGKAMH